MINKVLQELASAIPASVVRYGEFPVQLKFPVLIASNGTEKLVRLKDKEEKLRNNITSDGSINSVMTQFLASLHKSTGDFLSTSYYGNTLNLAPGGWGNDKSAVGFDFDDVFIHELGHTFSLPHWGEQAWGINPTRWQYLYPYSGDTGYDPEFSAVFNSTEAKGGGRGESWNFIQDIYEFINPICQFNERGKAGLETSDAMQRNNHCLGARSKTTGPWDGFGDFSAFAMHHYLVGAAQKNGKVWYKNEERDFQLIEQEGFPVMSLEEGKRVYSRDPIQIGHDIPLPYEEERFKGLGTELIEKEAYLIYGTTHPTQNEANIVYEHLKFKGTIPDIIDPTDTETIQNLKTDIRYETLFSSPRDIALKMYYEDGSTLHAIDNSSFTRQSKYPASYYNIWRYDLNNFSLLVPGDKKLTKVELYHRPFHISSWNATDPGYLKDPKNPITAENFMNSAELKASFPPLEKSLASRSIGNQVWFDLNKNGKHDEGEPGIPGVSIYLWGDSDSDGIPDVGISGGAVTITDHNGNYRYTGLAPGSYRAFVWVHDNWEVLDPLQGMISTVSDAPNANNDIDNDSNGCFLGANVQSSTTKCSSYLRNCDISTGIINLSESGEPLNDGDPSDGPFLDYDASGNMTIDFGFHYETPTSFYLNGILVIPNISANGANYYVELKLVDGSSSSFKLKTIKDADTGSKVFASRLEDGSIEIPEVTVNGILYKVGLSISSDPLTFAVQYAERM